ncbi:MAG: DoxX family protein [Pirellulaceae bacterium]
MVALVALRVGIGLHFSVEGIDKFLDPKPFSEPFLRISKGPFARCMEGLIWDKDGLARLDSVETQDLWGKFRARTVKRYGFDEKQQKTAEEIQKRREGQLQWHLDNQSADIDEYKKGLERRNAYRKDPTRREVASLRGQLRTIEGELNSKRMELLRPIEKVWDGYKEEMNQLATEAAGKPTHVSVPYPGRRLGDSLTIDVIIRYFDLTIGICLICGLFTRWVALAGAGFLFSICLSQWPLAPDAIPATYQFIEMLGMLVLAAVGAGQFAGADYLLGKLRKSCCPPQEGASS